MAAVKAAAAAILFIQLFRPSYQASMSGGDFDLRNSDMRSLGPALFSCYLEQPETTHSLNPKKCEPRVFIMQTISDKSHRAVSRNSHVVVSLAVMANRHSDP
jgi:hypothetical protein